MIGGLVGFLILVGMCVPDDTDTYPQYEDQNAAVVDSDLEAGIVPESQSAVDFDDPELQTSDQFIPDVSGDWNLYLNGQKVSVFSFTQDGVNVAYYEYDMLDARTAEGQGKIDGTDLLLDYYNTPLNVSGTISMSTFDDGQTWTGTINFPASGFNGTVDLRN